MFCNRYSRIMLFEVLFRSRRYHGTQQLNDSCQPGIHQFKVKMKHVWCKFVQNTVKCFQVWCLIHQAQLFIYGTVHWQVEPQKKAKTKNTITLQNSTILTGQRLLNIYKVIQHCSSSFPIRRLRLRSDSLRSAYTACFSKKGFHK